MKARGDGSIINVSSTAGFVTMDSYSATKAWVQRSTPRAWPTSWPDPGVRVTAVCPGWVRTEFHSRAEIGVSAIPEWMWLDADDVAAEGLRDNDRGQGHLHPLPAVRGHDVRRPRTRRGH